MIAKGNFSHYKNEGFMKPPIFLVYLFIHSLQIEYKKSDDLLNLTIIGTNENVTKEDYRKSGNYFDYIYIDIKSGITNICDEAFSGSTSLYTIFLPKTLLSIGSSAFSSCSKLTNFELPPSIKRIEDNTFMSCVSIRNLTIPANCNHVGTWHTFINCNSLSKFEVDSNNQYFFTSIDGKILIKADGTAVACVGSFSHITIPKGVTSIGEFFANGRSIINEIEFESGSLCTYIQRYAFRFTRITSIEIPEGVKQLDGAIFDNCPVSTITLPSTLVTVDQYLFSGSMSVSSVSLPKNCTGLRIDDSGVIFNSDKSLIMFMPGNITEFVIPKNILKISTESLRTNKNLVSLKTEANHTEFTACLNLLYNVNKQRLLSSIGGNINVIIDSNCTHISSSAFEGTDIRYVTVLGRITSIGNKAFYKCASLVSIDLTHVTEALDYAFNLCSITSITLSKSFETMGLAVFQQSKIVSVDMSLCEKIKVLPSVSFNNCWSLNELKLPPFLEEIGDSICSQCILDSLTIPCTVRRINTSAFASSKINKLIFGEGESQLTIVGDKAFSGCKFDTFIAPDSLTEIGVECFSGCSSLTTLTFSAASKLTSIPAGIIKGTKVEKIFIGKHVESITAGALSEAYELTKIQVSDENDRYKGEEGILYSYNFDRLILCGGGLSKVDVKMDVVEIAESAFLKCIKLSVLKFEEGSKLESIGPSTFFGCTSLDSLSFPSLLKYIESGAFEGCQALSKIEFPIECRVVSIGNRGFFGCQSLGEVVFSSLLETIGSSAFEGCTNLSSVMISGNIQMIGGKSFAGCSSLSTVDICISHGQNAFFAGDIFDGCSKLDWVIISESYKGAEVGGVPALRVLDGNCRRPTSCFTSAFETQSNVGLPLLISVVVSKDFGVSGRIDAQKERHNESDGSLYCAMK